MTNDARASLIRIPPFPGARVSQFVTSLPAGTKHADEAAIEGIPVCTVGDAIYDITGLTHQRHLDTFLTDPTPPEPGVCQAFRRVLVDRCLVHGGLASESAVSTLIESIVERLDRLTEVDSHSSTASKWLFQSGNLNDANHSI